MATKPWKGVALGAILVAGLCLVSEQSGAYPKRTGIIYKNPAYERLFHQPSQIPESARGIPGKADYAQGRRIYQANCAVCHGEQGRGDGLAASSLNPRPSDLTNGPFRHTANFEGWFEVISNGVPGTAMAPWSGTLTEDELFNVTAFVLGI